MKISSVPSLAIVLEAFFRQRLVAQKHASPATVSAYRDTLRMFLVFAAEKAAKRPAQLALTDLDRDVVLAFLDHLESERKNSIRTRNTRLAALRSFFHYTAYRDPAALGQVERILQIPTKRAMTKVVTYLTRPELEALLAAPNRETTQGRRDHALLLFLARTGARVSEATGVNAADLRWEKPWQVRLRGKGSKERVIPLPEDLATVLTALCCERGIPKSSLDPLFVNARGQRLTRYGVIHLLDRAVEKAATSCPELKKKSVSPHTLRHTTAMLLLQSGVDLTTIRSWMGHVKVDTTHHYVEADLAMKQKALDQCPLSESAPPGPYKPTDEVLALLDSL